MPETAIAAQPVDRETRNPVDVLRAYKLRIQHGLSYDQIATVTGQPKSSIHRALTDLCTLIDDPERLQLYDDAKVKLFTAVEEKLMSSLIDDAAISKASLNNRAYAFKQIHEARRLESGQSTKNVNILSTLIDRTHDTLFKGAALTPSLQAPAEQAGQD
jgi:hypothetical protein